MGGTIPNIQIFTEDGLITGSAYSNFKGEGKLGDDIPILVQPNKGMEDAKAGYVGTSAAGNNAICITAVSVAPPSGKAPRSRCGQMLTTVLT